MSIAKSYSAQLVGLESHVVTIEVDLSNGLNAFSVVGLGDRAVDEAKDRIAAAIKNSGFVSPKQKNQKVVISLAPADMRKEGTSFDLAMAITYLIAAGDVECDTAECIFLGELSLEGDTRRASGILPILSQASRQGFKSAFIPAANSEEASLAKGLNIYPVSSLTELISHISGRKRIKKLQRRKIISALPPSSHLDISAIRGNETAKRGLEIAAAGGHNIVMSGPPGTGKTMLAQCFTSLLPPLSYEHTIEVTGIYSAAGVLRQQFIAHPPFRAPHHTASYPAIVGGGNFPAPGEITLAHRGVLFLDEFPEFDRSVIEALRQPLEDKIITISRARGTITFPAQCIFMASMNPCPCGKGKGNGCICPSNIAKSYERRISGPIMDRIDVWVDVNKVDYEKLSARTYASEVSESVRKRVVSARERQKKRFEKIKSQKICNGEMNAHDIEQCVTIENDARSILASSAEQLGLSGRAFHRVIKVAQTIADLAGSASVQKEHMLEALQYRRKQDHVS